MPWSQNFKLLSWWKAASPKYPILSKMARDFLAIPLTLATSDEAFYSELRKPDRDLICLGPELMNALMCTRSWFEKHKRLFGYVFWLAAHVMEPVIQSEKSNQFGGAKGICSGYVWLLVSNIMSSSNNALYMDNLWNTLFFFFFPDFVGASCIMADLCVFDLFLSPCLSCLISKV
ncbi:uncharacterized protein LOC114313562 [Camellia sinensis]|uniref:uncharacterized protein LOC114313562 n=1 Tax=Camellia sinensis TaxID=4442 RepID=UPI001035F97D|nr:uncharacterized protein LOC114313562 [Camellia sinensis]